MIRDVEGCLRETCLLIYQYLFCEPLHRISRLFPDETPLPLMASRFEPHSIVQQDA